MRYTVFQCVHVFKNYTFVLLHGICLFITFNDVYSLLDFVESLLSLCFGFRGFWTTPLRYLCILKSWNWNVDSIKLTLNCHFVIVCNIVRKLRSMVQRRRDRGLWCVVLSSFRAHCRINRTYFMCSCVFLCIGRVALFITPSFRVNVRRAGSGLRPTCYYGT